MTVSERLKALDACREAVEWSERFGDDEQAAWDACERGDWMLWYCGRVSGTPESESRRKLVLCAVAVARQAWPFVRPGDRNVVKRCYETAEAWGRGDPGVMLTDVQAAALAAYAVAHEAAYAVAYAAYVAADAADVAAYARIASLRASADIVRGHYPTPPRSNT